MTPKHVGDAEDETMVDSGEDNGYYSTVEMCAKVKRLRREGRCEDAISIAEDGLHRTVMANGPRSCDTLTVAVDLVLAYNQLAMKMLSENDVKVCEDISMSCCAC